MEGSEINNSFSSGCSIGFKNAVLRLNLHILSYFPPLLKWMISKKISPWTCCFILLRKGINTQSPLLTSTISASEFNAS